MRGLPGMQMTALLATLGIDRVALPAMVSRIVVLLLTTAGVSAEQVSDPPRTGTVEVGGGAGLAFHGDNRFNSTTLGLLASAELVLSPQTSVRATYDWGSWAAAGTLESRDRLVLQSARLELVGYRFTRGDLNMYTAGGVGLHRSSAPGEPSVRVALTGAVGVLVDVWGGAFGAEFAAALVRGGTHFIPGRVCAFYRVRLR